MPAKQRRTPFSRHFAAIFFRIFFRIFRFSQGKHLHHTFYAEKYILSEKSVIY